MNCLARHPAGQGLVETQSVLHLDLLVTQQGVEGAGGRPPAQAGPGQAEVGDELVGGGEPRQEDLLLTAGLGTAIASGYQGVHLTNGYEERGGDEGDVLGEDPTGGLLTALLRPTGGHLSRIFTISVSPSTYSEAVIGV